MVRFSSPGCGLQVGGGVQGPCLRVQGPGSRVQGFEGSRVKVFRVQGSGVKAQGFRARQSGFRDRSLRSTVYIREFRAQNQMTGTQEMLEETAFHKRSGMDWYAYRTQSFSDVVLQKSIPTPIRQLTRYISNGQGQVDGFVRESTFADRLYEHFV